MHTRMLHVLMAACALAGATLLVTAASAGAVTVSDEAGLRAAFGDATETQIDLANDISLVDCAAGDLERNSATALTINGNGFTITQTCAGERVMRQAGTGAITVDGVTLTGGTDTGNGGGIDTDTAPITVTNSTISDNTAGGNGGGIAQTTGTVTVTNSTISGNTGELNGGGIAQTSGTVTVTNSTISGNTAGGNGGGIGQTGTSITLVYATVVQNGAAAGNNINGPGSDLSSFGSVVALAQGGGANCGFLASTTSNGFNFSDDATCGFTAGTDRQNAGDPGLGALADNGGPTPTHLPQAGSPLIDAIPATSCQADGASGITTDQRGVTRPQDSGCDIGAVEVVPAGPPAPPAPPSTPSAAVPVPATPRFTG